MVYASQRSQGKGKSFVGRSLYVFFMGEGRILINEGKIPSSSWNQFLPPQGASDELSWAEKVCADVSTDCIPALSPARGLP